MARPKFRNREERRAHMARRYLEMKKEIPWAGRRRAYTKSNAGKTKYKLGVITKFKRFVIRIFRIYPQFVAAGLIALIAYFLFQKANPITQWAGGLAISTLAIANPEASINIALKTHEYMSWCVVKAVGGEGVEE